MKNKSINQSNIQRVSPSIDFGLNDSQVNERVSAGLTNFVEKKYSKSYLSIFLNNICTYFNLLGLIVFISLLIFNDGNIKISNFLFVLIFLANILIGIIQEIRAKICIDRLTLISNKCVKVLRNGKTVEINPKDIVIDDIVLVGIGSQIPTDSKLLDGDLEVNESLLTGEFEAVKKHPGDTLLAGSFIISGNGKIIADKIGKDNYVEKLSEKARKYKKPQSELMQSLSAFIRTIGIIIVPIAVLFILKSTLISKLDIKIAIFRTSTIVIGMIPSGMFLLTSLALAVGIIKLAKHNTLVQDLYSLEMLARVDTICFDKTGTITDGKMSVIDVLNYDDTLPYSLNEIIGSMLNSVRDNNQTAIALYNYFGYSDKLKAKTVLPFNSTRKQCAVTFENEGTYSFGAPDFVLDKEVYEKIKDKINEYARKGLRVLLVAHNEKEIIDDKLPTGFIPIGLILIFDHIREEAISTIKWFKLNGIDIKVISGDNPITVAEVSKRAGVPNADKFINLEGLSDAEVYNSANKYTVFGRVSPEQKAILVTALKDAGHVTAMTGDGVNDILALKESDCAITVASGSEAARNVSHLVLMDDNFNSMPSIVYEGRRVINNVQSSASLYLMKTFFTMIFSLISLAYMESYPFQLNQMILLETFVIGFPSFFLSLQANDKKVEGRFITYVIDKSIPSAILMVISVLLVEIFKSALPGSNEQLIITMEAFVLTFAGLISLFTICKPLNLYRSILFGIVLSVITCVFIVTIINGFSILEYVSFAPFKQYWKHLLTLIFIVLIDIPTMMLLEKLFKQIKLEKPIKIIKKPLK